VVIEITVYSEPGFTHISHYILSLSGCEDLYSGLRNPESRELGSKFFVHMTYIQKSIFKLSTALSVDSGGGPIIWPVHVTPVMSKVDHLRDNTIISIKS